MPKFRKKPVVVEAMQYTGDHLIVHWIAQGFGSDGITSRVREEDQELYISTLEGEMHISVGDWIIKGVAGEFYPCKPDIFEQTYEPAEEGARFGL